MQIKKTVDFNIKMEDVVRAMHDARCRHHIVEAAAKRLGLPLEYHKTGAVNLKGNDMYAQSAEIGVGREIKNPTWKIERFDNILHHFVLKGKKVRVQVVSTG